jgi:DNA invertase Pin-like site-specific DNA recombinase
MIVYGYVRTARRGDERSMQGQFEAVETYGRAIGGEMLRDDTWIDDGVQGTVAMADRPEGGKLWMKIIRSSVRVEPGPVHVVINTLDRLGRELDDLVDLLKKWGEHGVVLHVVSPPQPPPGILPMQRWELQSLPVQMLLAQMRCMTLLGRFILDPKDFRFG